MKKIIPMLSWFFLLLAFARADEGLWPMSSFLPTVPPGANSATYPVPRVDWVARARANIEAANKLGDSIHLVFDGDSITDFWQTRGAEIWKARYAQYGAFDFGISGDRTQHLLWRLSQGQAAGLHPKLIALMIGTNNSSSNSSQEIADGVQAIIQKYQTICPDAVILLQAIFPRGHLPTDPSRAKIKEINGLIAKFADGNKVLYVDFGAQFLESDGTLSPAVMPDFLHPSAKGYQIWAEAIQPIIDKYLK